MDPAESPASDARALSTGVARGDSRAFAAFYEAYFDFAYATARRLTRRDESFCLDVVHDSMLRVVRSLRRLDTHGELRAWLTRVVHTTALDALRAESRRVLRERGSVERTAGQSAELTPEERLELDERIVWLEARLRELEPEERGLLERRFRRGGSFARLGADFGMSGNAAHGKVRRLIERLRASARRWSGDLL